MLNSKEKKSNLEMFIKLITGHFNNKEQFEEMQKSGRVYPYAEHVNTVCNDKIKNLPVDFQGKFLVEESYYETNGKKHLCLLSFFYWAYALLVSLYTKQTPMNESRGT